MISFTLFRLLSNLMIVNVFNPECTITANCYDRNIIRLVKLGYIEFIYTTPELRWLADYPNAIVITELGKEVAREYKQENFLR